MLRIIILLLVAANCFGQSLETQTAKLVHHPHSPAAKTVKSLSLGRCMVQVPVTAINKRTGTIDSDRGVVTVYGSKQHNKAKAIPDTFMIYYDIGFMAGKHMDSAFKKDCSYFSEKMINGYKAAIGLKKKDNKTEIIVSIWGDYKKEKGDLPANFWATVKDGHDVKTFLDVVFTFKKQ
jgi:hypothetical protein